MFSFRFVKQKPIFIAAEDIEAGTSKLKFQTEPTLPIYLKVTVEHAGFPVPSFNLQQRLEVLKSVFVNGAWIDLGTIYLDRQGMENCLKINAIHRTLIAGSGSVLYRVSSYMTFMYKTLPSFQQMKKKKSESGLTGIENVKPNYEISWIFLI